MPPNDLRERRHDDGHSPLEPDGFERAPAGGAQRPGAVRVVHDERRVVLLAEVDELAKVCGVPVERVDALAHDEGVLALARLQDALEALGRVVVEEANLGAVLGHAGGEEGAVEDARVAVRVEDERRVLVGQRREGAEHRLVARREREALLEAHPLREALLELDVLARRRLRTRRRQPARVLRRPRGVAASFTLG